MEQEKIIKISLIGLSISIIWGLIQTLTKKANISTLFTKDYLNWILSLKELFSNDFYFTIWNKLTFLLKTGYYLLFTIGIIILIIVLASNLIQKRKSPSIEYARPQPQPKYNTQLDYLIKEGENSIKNNQIAKARNIYSQIKEETKNKNYSKEQYERIIQLYKKLIV